MELEPSDGHLEQEAYAEHRAALDATLFPTDPPLVFELRDGVLEYLP